MLGSVDYFSGIDLETRGETVVRRQCFRIMEVSRGYDPRKSDDSGQLAYLLSCVKNTDHLVFGKRVDIGFPFHRTGFIEDFCRYIFGA